LVDGITVALLLDETEDGAHKLLVLGLHVKEKVRLPLHECKRVNRINRFSPLVPLSLHPVAVEISEKTIDVVCACGVAIPFGGVVTQQSFILECFRFFSKSLEMSDKVTDEVVVKI